MATSIKKLGDHSQSITYTANTTVAEMLTALDSVMVAQGWELFDTQVSANAHCYRAPCENSSAFKYVVLDMANSSYLVCKVYEGWNSATHVGINLAFSSDLNTYGQQLTLTMGGLVWIFATARYVALYSRTATGVYGSNSGGAFCGCFEISRDNGEEVPGKFPLFAWMNGAAVTGALLATTTSTYCFALPRTRSGQTASAASMYNSVGCLTGRASCRSNILYPLYYSLPEASNPFSSTGNLISLTPYAIECDSSGRTSVIRGRFYGFKLTPMGIGSIGDSINIKVDDKLFVTDAQTAVPKQHMLVREAYSNGRFAFPL